MYLWYSTCMYSFVQLLYYSIWGQQHVRVLFSFAEWVNLLGIDLFLFKHKPKEKVNQRGYFTSVPFAVSSGSTTTHEPWASNKGTRTRSHRTKTVGTQQSSPCSFILLCTFAGQQGLVINVGTVTLSDASPLGSCGGEDTSGLRLQ
jgi:hypothetical protein